MQLKKAIILAVGGVEMASVLVSRGHGDGECFSLKLKAHMLVSIIYSFQKLIQIIDAYGSSYSSQVSTITKRRTKNGLINLY